MINNMRHVLQLREHGGRCNSALRRCIADFFFYIFRSTKVKKYLSLYKYLSGVLMCGHKTLSEPVGRRQEIIIRFYDVNVK